MCWHSPALRRAVRLRTRAPSDELIHVKARVRDRVHKYAMIEDLTPNEVACPICGRPMTLQIIRRAFAENLYAFECKPCGLSMTEPEKLDSHAIVTGR
jgi:hypothetical protein